MPTPQCHVGSNRGRFDPHGLAGPWEPHLWALPTHLNTPLERLRKHPRIQVYNLKRAGIWSIVPLRVYYWYCACGDW